MTRRSLTRSVVVLAPTAAVLVAYGLIVAFVIKPPLLGWIGFAIVSMVALGLAALGPLAFERTRVSALRTARAVDRNERLLVVADPRCNENALCDEILAHVGTPSGFMSSSPCASLIFTS